MPAMPVDLMGYDRAITVFSPDGRLLQVEYARKTVSQGATAIGIVCKDGVVLVADKRVLDKLIVASSIEKVFQIDTHIGCTMSGLISDGRILVERAQEEAQRHKLVYDEAIDIITLVRELCNYKQYYTQYAGVRPFGVSLLIAGVDEKPRLFLTEPSGIFFEYKAVAIGEGAPIVNKILEEKYDENITVENGIELSMKAIKKFLGEKFSKDRIDVAIVDIQTKKYKKISGEELDKYTKE